MSIQTLNPKAQTENSQPILHQQGREIRPFGTLRNLPIALFNAALSESCEQLNQILADSTILYSLYKKHHWLMRDNTFYQVHLLMDKHADEQLKLLDLLAEQVQTLGGVAIANSRQADVLEVLLDSVYTETPHLSLNELRAPESGKAALNP